MRFAAARAPPQVPIWPGQMRGAVRHPPAIARRTQRSLDGRKSLEAARAGCHIHLDEVVERAAAFTTPHLVLMHVSQLYQPAEVAPILDARLPAELRARTQVLLPDGTWPG